MARKMVYSLIVLLVIYTAFTVWNEVKYRNIKKQYYEGFPTGFFDSDAKPKRLNLNKWIGDPRLHIAG